MRFSKERNIPVVLDIRDIWPDVFFSKFISFFSKILNYSYSTFIYNLSADIRNVKSLTGVSEEYVNWARKFTNSKKTESKVFPIGYRIPTISKKERQLIRSELKEQGVDDHDFLCTFVGQLSTTYDIENLIEVSKMFHNTNIKIVIGGTGEKQSLVKRGLKGNNNLIYLGWISQDVISILLEMSSVGLVSYSQNATQSLPNKPFEYMAYSLPLISSLRGELDMILDNEKNGLKYKAGSTKELYDAIKYLQKNKDVQFEMRKRSFKLFFTKYSNKKIYPLMADFIESAS
jgi:glycosyltransferase involved in cell wall biosynthesis